MSEWVLVPSEVDDETCEDIWNVAYGEWAEFGSMDKDAGRAAIVAMLAARPPIPRTVWDAMVERGARESWNNFADYRGNWDSDVKEETKVTARDEWEIGLRAALGNPMVEGDEP